MIKLGILIYCYNSSTIKLSKNQALHGTNNVKFHFLHDLAKEEVVKQVYFQSQDQITDI